MPSRRPGFLLAGTVDSPIGRNLGVLSFIKKNIVESFFSSRLRSTGHLSVPLNVCTDRNFWSLWDSLKSRPLGFKRQEPGTGKGPEGPGLSCGSRKA